jgi:CheY-like chemotaxis protein
MYRRIFRILVVDTDVLALYQAVRALKQRDYLVATAVDIEQARWWLTQWPIDLLVVGSKLGPHRGLNFVASVRAELPDIAVILIGGEEDHALTMDAWRQRVALVLRPYEATYFLMVAAEQLAAMPKRQRWPRKQVVGVVPLHVGGRPARLLDASYGGLKFEFNGEAAELPSPLTITLPRKVEIRAEVVWSAPAPQGHATVCGVALSDEHVPSTAWRRFVDRLPESRAAG